MEVDWTFTDREGGASAPSSAAFNLGSNVGDAPSAVAARRAELAHRHGLEHIVWMDQVHSATVAVVDQIPAGPLPATDGMVTRVAGLGLAVLVADCVPVLAHDAANGVIGVAHAGRVGAAAGIAVRLIGTMESQGADRGAIQVALGPAICGRCYEVPAAMQAEVEAALPGSAVETSSGTAGLDLRAGIEAQLGSVGVWAVTRSGRCTFEDDELFSFRREASAGRQAGLIWLLP